MRLIEILPEAKLDDIGTRVQGLGGSISGNVPNALPPGSLRRKIDWSKMLTKMKKRRQDRKKKEEECEFSVNL